MTPRSPRPIPDAPPRADVGRVCFADEVAIDFPSVHAVVDRMRDAFLGTPGDTTALPFRAEILLSRAEAQLGRDVRHL